jgi:hypothetical protein
MPMVNRVGRLTMKILPTRWGISIGTVLKIPRDSAGLPPNSGESSTKDSQLYVGNQIAVL